MVGEYQGQHGIGTEDPLGLLARTPRRSALQELRDYPFFAPDEEIAQPTWVLRHGGALLIVLALVSIVEIVVLGLLLR